MPKKTPAELERALSSVCKVIGQIPYFHIYERTLADIFDASDRVQESIQAMSHNAALDSTLLKHSMLQ